MQNFGEIIELFTFVSKLALMAGVVKLTDIVTANFRISELKNWYYGEKQYSEVMNHMIFYRIPNCRDCLESFIFLIRLLTEKRDREVIFFKWWKKKRITLKKKHWTFFLKRCKVTGIRYVKFRKFPIRKLCWWNYTNLLLVLLFFGEILKYYLTH